MKQWINSLLNTTMLSAQLLNPSVQALVNTNSVGTNGGADIPTAVVKDPATNDYSHIERVFIGVGNIKIGLVQSSEIVDTTNGVINWMGSVDVTNNIVGRIDSGKLNDPRYKLLTTDAKPLNTLYPFDKIDPTNIQAITDNERAISTALMQQEHTEQLYGPYNTNIDNPLPTTQLVYDSWDAATGKAAPHSLKDEKTGSWICSEFAVPASAALEKAGIPNILMTGFVTTYAIGEDYTLDQMSDGPQGHAWVVSRRTGNIIETTIDGTNSYLVNFNNQSLENILVGEPIVVAGGDTNGKPILMVYSMGSTNSQDIGAAIGKPENIPNPYIYRDKVNALMWQAAQKAYDDISSSLDTLKTELRNGNMIVFDSITSDLIRKGVLNHTNVSEIIIYELPFALAAGNTNLVNTLILRGAINDLPEVKTNIDLFQSQLTVGDSKAIATLTKITEKIGEKVDFNSEDHQTIKDLCTQSLTNATQALKLPAHAHMQAKQAAIGLTNHNVTFHMSTNVPPSSIATNTPTKLKPATPQPQQVLPR